MTKIYRKTGTIKAEQFDYTKWTRMRHEAYPMVFCDIAKDGSVMLTNPFIKTLEGDINISDGDWIATSINNEHWAIADVVFKKTYAELPVIPNCVADYINDMKASYRDIWDAMHYPFISDKMDKYMEDNSEIFARAWLDGFQTED